MEQVTMDAMRATLTEAARLADADREAGRRDPNGVCARAVAELGLPAEVGGETVQQIVLTLVLEGGIPPNRLRSADLALPAWAVRQPPGAIAEAMKRTVHRLETAG